jgi:hypothetical protein
MRPRRGLLLAWAGGLTQPRCARSGDGRGQRRGDRVGAEPGSGTN